MLGLFCFRFFNIEHWDADETNPTTITLTPTGVPTGTGTQLYLLLIEFFQEVNGIQYPLRNGAFNVLNLIDIV